MKKIGKSKMRILIDLQGAQTASRYRGIGRYSTSLTKELINLAVDTEIYLLLNGNLSESIDSIRGEFLELLPTSHIKVWFGPEVSDLKKLNYQWSLRVAIQIREFYIASLEPDIVLISSFFEGFRNNAVLSINQFNTNIPTAVIFYDLIPLLNPEQYLAKSPEYEKFYRNKLEELKRADQFLSISESASAELQALIEDKSKIVSISCGVDAVFKSYIHKSENDGVLSKFGITSPYIFYSGGSDSRKNLPRLLAAYFNLPRQLQNSFQLVIAGKISEIEKGALKNEVKNELNSKQLIFSGYVSDHDLATLYNKCCVFVLPSTHEGFGLPALEAMACGAAVIGSNTTSIPEVIEYEDALFDPFSIESIEAKLTHVLSDKNFRDRLSTHGIKQAEKFSWQATAIRALQTLELAHLKNSVQKVSEKNGITSRKPRLAMVTPLPPEKSGVADYAAQLLPELLKIYDVEIVVAQKDVSFAGMEELNLSIRDVQWFLEHGHEMDFVVYQFGNSIFHHHMFSLLELIPGVVVLHDFYLSDIFYYLEHQDLAPFKWTQALYFSHGYPALRKRYHSDEPESLKSHYPVNLQLLEAAKGVIVHSQSTKNLGSKWYGENFTKDWQVLPLVRNKKEKLGRSYSRKKLGIADSDFVICSFGFLDSTKLNDVLLTSWMNTDFAHDKSCKLIFVGQNEGGAYGQRIKDCIAEHHKNDQIFITNWTDEVTYQLYLETADCAVQLRAHSRGETSAAALDCLAYGIPTIVNAHGSLTDIPADIVLRLDDHFADHDLTAALNRLKADGSLRLDLSAKAQAFIEHKHSPTICAQAYSGALKAINDLPTQAIFNLVSSLNALGTPPSDIDARVMAQSIVQTFPLLRPKRQLLLDITATYYSDLHTGIERTARALMNAFIDMPDNIFRVEPVYLQQEKNIWQYQYARSYTLSAMDCPKNALSDDIVEAQDGDVLIVLDLSGHRLKKAEKSGLLEHYRQRGIKIFFILYDLLPLQLPHCFPGGAVIAYSEWLDIALKSSGLFCISRSVADDVEKMIHTNEIPFAGDINWFHLGSNLSASVPSKGLPQHADSFLRGITGQINFLMVGTIEPRKCHQQVIDAFTLIWQENIKVNLIIVGKEGWKSVSPREREPVDAAVKKITHHTEYNSQLYWIDNASDEYLEKIYQRCDCLIAASAGEGFGLPITEAAQHGLSVIARDIPVFREVAAEGALYFQGSSGADLANVILEWHKMFHKNTQPVMHASTQCSWLNSANEIYKKIIQD